MSPHYYLEMVLEAALEFDCTAAFESVGWLVGLSARVLWGCAILPADLTTTSACIVEVPGSRRLKPSRKR